MEPGGTHKLCKRSVDATNVDFAFLTVITILKSLFYLAGRRWNHEKGHWNQPLNFSVFFGTHFCEKPSKSDPRRVPAGPHFLFFFHVFRPLGFQGCLMRPFGVSRHGFGCQNEASETECSCVLSYRARLLNARGRLLAAGAVDPAALSCGREPRSRPPM